MAYVRKIKKIFKFVGFVVSFSFFIIITIHLPNKHGSYIFFNEESNHHLNNDKNTAFESQMDNIVRNFIKTTPNIVKYESNENVLLKTTHKISMNTEESDCTNGEVNTSLILSPHHWHTLYNSNSHAMHLYSAYLDQKDADIKIISVARAPVSLYCHIWFVHKDQTIIKVSRATIQIVPETHSKRFAAYIIKCPIPHSYETKLQTPFLVAVLENRCSNSNYFLPIQAEVNTEPKYTYTVCSTPINRNYSDVGEFLEFLEVNSMFGAEHFILYNHSIGDQLLPYIQSYIDDGIVELLDWNIPLVVGQGPINDIHYFGQLAALNDCLYKSRLHSKYTAFLDLDEIIVPAQKHSWSEVINKINLDQPAAKYSVYVFSNVFFRKDWATNNKFVNNLLAQRFKLRTLSYTKREVKTWPSRQRSKYIGDPNLIQIAGIHYPWKIRQNSYQVKESDALLFHYRNWEEYKPKPFLENERMLQFNKTILQRIGARIEKVQL